MVPLHAPHEANRDLGARVRQAARTGKAGIASDASPLILSAEAAEVARRAGDADRDGGGALVPSKLDVSGDVVARAAMGGEALVLQVIADGVVGSGLRDLTPADQVAYFLTPAGAIYGAALLAFAAMPALVKRDRP
jgi:hypothetical protein